MKPTFFCLYSSSKTEFIEIFSKIYDTLPFHELPVHFISLLNIHISRIVSPSESMQKKENTVSNQQYLLF